jgi:enterochelin esterase-like enzyme
VFQISDPRLAPRLVRVIPPAGYARTDRRFPVLYAHDGQVAIGEGLRVRSAVESLVRRGAIRPHIIVAVDASAARSRELKPLPRSPSLTDYGNLLVMQIKPLVDRHFRTLPGRASTAVIGYSLGGLANVYLMMRFPTVFGRVACMSPSLWWRGGRAVRDFARHRGQLPARLWIDAGAEERGFLRHTRGLRRLALRRGMVLGRDLGYLEQPGAAHGFGAGGARMHLALGFVLAER